MHHWAGATLSLKNLFGILPGICYGWPKNELHWRGIPHSIIDIALTQTPDLAIVDGITGMEGDGPLNGACATHGSLDYGDRSGCGRRDVLPADGSATGASSVIVAGRSQKLGRIVEAQIPQLGEPIAKLEQVFELPPKIEKMLIPA